MRFISQILTRVYRKEKGEPKLPFCIDTNAASELNPQRELQLARICITIHAGPRTDCSVTTAGGTEVDVVEEIECVHAELN